MVVSLAGVTGSYQLDVPSGPAIVLLAIAVFALFSVLAAPLARRRHRARPEHGPEVCDVELPAQGVLTPNTPVRSGPAGGAGLAQ